MDRVGFVAKTEIAARQTGAPETELQWFRQRII